jgi:hypothetical protein
LLRIAREAGIDNQGLKKRQRYWPFVMGLSTMHSVIKHAKIFLAPVWHHAKDERIATQDERFFEKTSASNRRAHFQETSDKKLHQKTIRNYYSYILTKICREDCHAQHYYSI